MIFGAKSLYDHTIALLKQAKGLKGVYISKVLSWTLTSIELFKLLHWMSRIQTFEQIFGIHERWKLFFIANFEVWTRMKSKKKLASNITADKLACFQSSLIYYQTYTKKNFADKVDFLKCPLRDQCTKWKFRIGR